MKATKKAFESSKFDKDKGMKEGSPKDMKKDSKEIPAFKKAVAKDNKAEAAGKKPMPMKKK